VPTGIIRICRASTSDPRILLLELTEYGSTEVDLATTSAARTRFVCVLSSVVKERSTTNKCGLTRPERAHERWFRGFSSPAATDGLPLGAKGDITDPRGACQPEGAEITNPRPRGGGSPSPAATADTDREADRLQRWVAGHPGRRR